MKSKGVTILFAPATLLLYIFTAAFSVEGAVLCLGEDGHYGIEFVDTCNNPGAGKGTASSLMTETVP